jgi:hypothetical protein
VFLNDDDRGTFSFSCLSSSSHTVKLPKEKIVSCCFSNVVYEKVDFVCPSESEEKGGDVTRREIG